MRDLDWKILYELYKNPNLTQVSKLLYLTQPTLTKRLKLVEEELDTTIVNRTPKGLTLTEEGRYLGEKAGEYLQFREEIDAKLLEFKQEQTEYLHIGSAYTFSKFMLRPLLNPFLTKHPNLNLKVTNLQSNTLHQMLLDGAIDAAFIRGDYTQGVSSVPILPDYGYIVTKNPVDLQRLPQMNRILYQTSGWTEQQIEKWWEEWFGKTAFKAVGSAGYVDFALNAISDDDAYVLCFLPSQASVPQGMTATPMTMRDGSQIVRSTWFIYRNEKRISLILEEFIRFVEKEATRK